VQVPPSTPEETLEILAGLKGHYEKHHNVCFSEDTLV
jgi:ATP-dependent Clp protease ATP-binding subunit ClpA